MLSRVNLLSHCLIAATLQRLNCSPSELGIELQPDDVLNGCFSGDPYGILTPWQAFPGDRRNDCRLHYLWHIISTVSFSLYSLTAEMENPRGPTPSGVCTRFVCFISQSVLNL